MIIRLFFLFGLLILFSCESDTKSKIVNQQKEESLSAVELLNRTPSELNVYDYLLFLKQLKGIAFDEVETPEVAISLLYKPQTIEAALSLPPDELKSSFKDALTQKEGYHYLLVNYLDKSPSVTGNKPSKQEVLTMIREQLIVVKNESDTLQAITEVVPSSISGQPDQIIVLVPKSSTDLRLKVLLPGNYFDSRDIAIDLPMSMLHQFPELTL
jgi:hypothetical protein